MSRRHWWPVYVGVGSNLDSPEDQVRRAIAALGELPDTIVVSQSGLYRSAPLGHAEQPDFVNAVAGLLTQIPVRELLEKLFAIERKLGRRRGEQKWSSRTIDLDLLAYSGQVIDEEGLKLPHPGIAGRNFVLLPWQEIAPSYRVPGLTEVAELAAAISTTEPQIRRIG